MVGHILLAGLLVSFVACGMRGGDDEDRAAQAPARVQADGTIRLSGNDQRALGLAIDSAIDADVPNSTLRFGIVVARPDNDAAIVSPVSGRIARPPAVSAGATVRAGAPIVEVLPVLDTAERIAVGTQSAQRNGEIEAARREAARTREERDRARALAPQVVSLAALQAAETAAAQAQARLDALERAASVSTTTETRAQVVRAPIGGVVAALTVNVGAPVKAGDVLGRIARAGPVWVDVAVPPDAPVGDRYEVAAGDQSIDARLLARGVVTDSDGTRHDRLAVDAAHAARLVPGASVTVRVVHGATRGVVVPESALVPGVDGDLVFVETAASVFASRVVRVAARFGGQARIEGDVQSGDKVVVRGAMALYGERVRAQLQPS